MKEVKPKLAAILGVDVKGYSLMSEEEVGAIDTLNTYKDTSAGFT